MNSITQNRPTRQVAAASVLQSAMSKMSTSELCNAFALELGKRATVEQNMAQHESAGSLFDAQRAVEDAAMTIFCTEVEADLEDNSAIIASRAYPGPASLRAATEINGFVAARHHLCPVEMARAAAKVALNCDYCADDYYQGAY